MKSVAAFVSGLLFSLGLTISGMIQPSNIIGFLDVFGDWRPALAWVMVGAVAVYAALYRVVLKRKAPLFESRFDLPAQKTIDRRLILGSAIFGVGWGLGGFCPGPALVALGMGAQPAAIFFAAMLLGMGLHHLASEKKTPTDPDACG